MTVHLKLPTFKGTADEDMERFCFVTESLWVAQGVVGDTMKKVQLSLAFEGRTMDWYMGYISQNKDATIHNIKDALRQQFQNPKSYSQVVAELKYFKQGATEHVWEEDQCLKKPIREGGFRYDDK